MDSSARNSLLIVSISLLLHPPIIPTMASSKKIIFNFPPFSAMNLALSGNYSLQNHSLWLTSNATAAVPAPYSSTSAAVFRHPISYNTSRTQCSTSFTTNFSFSIANLNSYTPSTNVLMFFLAPSTPTCSLFLPHAIKNGSNLAIEFFTSQFPKARDGTVIVDIQYKNDQITLRVWLGKIKKPAFTESFKIPSLFVEHHCVGLASLKQNSSEAHVIHTWSLEVSQKKPAISGGLKTLSFFTFLALAIAVLGLACYYVREWVRRKMDERAKDRFLKNFRRFKFSEIRAAANEFGEEELIGHGGSSYVFKFKLLGSPTTFAVKRFKRDIGSQRGYMHELSAIRRIRHGNILELRGWADFHSREKLLVYDFMPNGSLRRALESQDVDALPWRFRHEVAIKVASAVTYLHDECVPAVFHCDIKCDNVLFDGDFEPKLADFGISLAGPPYSSVGGSRAYAPPEWRMGAAVDASYDVYSFGVLLLEICSGKSPKTAAPAYVTAVREMEEQDKLLQAVDQRLGNGFDPEEMERLLRLGLACTDADKLRRPTMARILMILRKEAELLEQQPEGEEGRASSSLGQPVGEEGGASSSLSRPVREGGAAS